MIRSSMVFNLLAIIILSITSINYVYANPDNNFIVESTWLSNQLKNNNKNIIIYDTRKRHDYMRNHIPTAISFPIDEVYVKSEGAYYVKNKINITPVLRKKGVNENKQIIIYDEGDMLDASQLFWVLDLYGIKNVAILNGGIKSWGKQDLTTENIEHINYSNYIPVLDSKVYASTIVVKFAAYSHLYKLYDSRTKAEFLGEKSLTSKFGRIPKAIHFNNKKFFYTDSNGVQYLKSKDKLDSLVSHLDKTRKSVTYCNKGKASALTYIILKQAGFQVAHYDGSWLDWSAKGLPIEK